MSAQVKVINPINGGCSYSAASSCLSCTPRSSHVTDGNFFFFLFDFFHFFHFGIDKLTEGSTIPALWALLTGSMTKGLILQEFCVWCLCMYALFYINLCIKLCHDWFDRFERICGLMTCVQNDQETDYSLFLALIVSFVVDWAQSRDMERVESFFRRRGTNFYEVPTFHREALIRWKNRSTSLNKLKLYYCISHRFQCTSAYRGLELIRW